MSDPGPPEPAKPSTVSAGPSGRWLPLRLWWQGLRPKTLPLAVTPVIVGGALAWRDTGTLEPLVLTITLLTAVLIQGGTNLFNDAKDAMRGNDGPDRPGPQRLTASGLATAPQVLRSAWLLFGFALLGGAWLVLQGGPGILAIGIAALVAGWAYSGGPLPLSHTALGEMFVIAFFGVAAVAGTYVLQAGSHSMVAVLLGLALGAQAAAVLIVNNARDLEADRLAGRRTLAGALGARGTLIAYGAMMLLPFPLIAIALRDDRSTFLNPCWLALPYAAWLVWRFARETDGPARNRQLAMTAFAQLLLGALMALTLLLSID